MSRNEISKEMKNKSFWTLKEIIQNNNECSEEEIQAAKKELIKRGYDEFDRHTENKKVKKDIIDNSVSSDSEPEEFPAKPKLEINSSSIQKSLISIGLFIVAFYLIFKWEISYILVLAGVILIHELGHYLAMKIFNYKDLSIFFVPLVGAYASGSKDTVSQKQRVIILLSGPIPGVIIGLILYYYGLRDESKFLLRTSNIFILINLFNLLPIMPLDGGKMIKSLFFENNEVINKIFLFLSIAILTYYSINSQSYFLLIIPFFLLMQLSSQSQIKKTREAVIKKGINIDKSYEELSNVDYWLIRDEIATNIKYFSRIISPKNYNISSEENKIIEQVKAIIQKKPIKDLKNRSKIMITILWILTFIIPAIVIAMYYIRLGVEI